MKNIFKIYFFTALVLLGVSCNSELEDQLDNPNVVGADKIDVNLLSNKIFVGFADFYRRVTEPTQKLTRILALTAGDTYSRAYKAEDFNTLWENAYQDVLVQIEVLLKYSNGKNLSTHDGAMKTLKAFTYLTLVDVFGDVPFSQAIQGVDGNFNPGVDKGENIYAACIKLLDEAIVDLAKTPVSGITRDIYYGGNKTKWTALANTLKLRAYMNMGDKAKVAEMLTANLIDTDAEEFTYKYGDKDIPVKSKNWLYREMYQPTAGEADGYLSNDFMLQMYSGKSVEDPRWRYYFYRQVGSIEVALDEEPESVTCVNSPKVDHYGPKKAWCSFDPGFFGRDHGNNDGIPPDGKAITVVGVYPFGGRVDLNNGNAKYKGTSKLGQGANGAGIEPIFMASFSSFLKAEAALRLGVEGVDAKAEMIKGVENSIKRVIAFGKEKAQEVPASIVTPTADYLDELNLVYDKSSDKLDVVMTEFWVAAYGSGLEFYNAYRRTGKPKEMQPMRSANGGKFLRSFPYPADFVNLNSSTVQKNNAIVNKVFWDKNSDDFVF